MPGSGVYRLSSGGVVVNPDALLRMDVPSLTAWIGARLADAAHRLSLASRHRVVRAGSSVAYDNVVYALASADPSETEPSLAARIVRLATAVSKSSPGITPNEVVPLIMAAAVTLDFLAFAPQGSSARADYEAVVASFTKAIGTSGRRLLRGVPASLDPGFVQEAVEAALARSSSPGAPAAPGSGAGGPFGTGGDPPSSPHGAGSPPPSGLPLHPAVKTPGVICHMFRTTGKCRYADRCKFEHVRDADPPGGRK